MTDPQAPTTEAGRELVEYIAQATMLPVPVWRDRIAAIEAEARAAERARLRSDFESLRTTAREQAILEQGKRIADHFTGQAYAYDEVLRRLEEQP